MSLPAPSLARSFNKLSERACHCNFSHLVSVLCLGQACLPRLCRLDGTTDSSPAWSRVDSHMTGKGQREGQLLSGDLSWGWTLSRAGGQPRPSLLSATPTSGSAGPQRWRGRRPGEQWSGSVLGPCFTVKLQQRRAGPARQSSQQS